MSIEAIDIVASFHRSELWPKSVACHVEVTAPNGVRVHAVAPGVAHGPELEPDIATYMLALALKELAHQVETTL